MFQRDNDLRPDHPGADLRRAAAGGFLSGFRGEQVKRPSGHRDSAKTFGFTLIITEGFGHRDSAKTFSDDEGKTNLLRARDGHAQIVPQQFLEVPVMYATNHQGSYPQFSRPRKSVLLHQGTADHDLVFVLGLEMRSGQYFVRTTDRQGDRASGFATDAENPLDEGAVRFDNDSL